MVCLNKDRFLKSVLNFGILQYALRYGREVMVRAKSGLKTRSSNKDLMYSTAYKPYSIF